MMDCTLNLCVTERFQPQVVNLLINFFVVTNLENVVEALGLRLDLLGVFQHPLIQHQRLTPLLHQHIRLGYEETPEEHRGKDKRVRLCIKK